MKPMGGNLKFLSAGLIYDTRDIEANPSKGLWTEAIIMSAPRFLGNNENAFTKLVITQRQYFTLMKERLTFVYRLGFQSTIDGNAPFYFQPLIISSYSPPQRLTKVGWCEVFEGNYEKQISR